MNEVVKLCGCDNKAGVIEGEKETDKKENRIMGEMQNISRNSAKVFFDAKSENESFARMVVMAFMSEMNPTLDELEDVKTAVSEAVTNAIVHGYGEAEDCKVEMTCFRIGNKLEVSIFDNGVGIEDVEKARQPFFTTKPELERTGMGFTFMESFMDEVKVISEAGKGTCVTLIKYIGAESELEDGREECE